MDMTRNLYAKGLPQFDKDITDILRAIKQGENVCLCSAPKMGDNMLLDYFAYRLNIDKDYDVIYSQSNELNFKAIRDKITKKPSKPILMLIPWLHNPVPGFYEEFENLFLTTNENTFNSVIRLHFDFLIKPKKYFPRSIRPVSYIKTRKPFNLRNTRHVIEQRRELNGWKVEGKYEKKIFELSGGVPGLIKRLCSYVNSYGGMNFKDIIEYPPVMMALKEFEEVFSKFPEEKIKRLGLLDSRGKIRSSLIDYAVNKRELNEKKFAPQIKRLFDYMKERKGEVVSMEEISEQTGNKEFSLWSNYKAIERLKKQLPPSYRIINLKGKGYTLKHK